ncbi:BCCT family transporter [Bacillus sp. V3B]|uniref:BCCT family transporter n=1 Tax=Bacillus sp. V3B TaxID=2804915 RepID=UPI0035C7564D
MARVSKGRTVREFTIAVLMIPMIVCAFWFSVFGGAPSILTSSRVLKFNIIQIEAASFKASCLIRNVVPY